MYLGERRIRSAGRTSGSIEITLPARLHVLEGVECSLVVRDGLRPEIVLQPDLSDACVLFGQLWENLRLGLAEVGEIDDFSLSRFTLALFPPAHWRERPPLAYADALAVLQGDRGQDEGGREALTRLLAFLAVAAGHQLGLEGGLAVAFGDAVAYLATGLPAGLGTDFERGMAHRLFWGDSRVPRLQSFPLGEAVWRRARSGLRAVYGRFHTWQTNPASYGADREKWYRALTVEMGRRASTVRAFVGDRQEATSRAQREE